ncbi:hypothetical protein ISCGN_029966 [Ixodes scapularis]
MGLSNHDPLEALSLCFVPTARCPSACSLASLVTPSKSTLDHRFSASNAKDTAMLPNIAEAHNVAKSALDRITTRTALLNKNQSVPIATASTQHPSPAAHGSMQQPQQLAQA